MTASRNVANSASLRSAQPGAGFDVVHLSGRPRRRNSAVAVTADDPIWGTLVSGDVGSALQEIEGPFAVAVRRDGRTVLAVDRFAIETLCFKVEGGDIEVSGRADELAHGDAIDLQALFSYLYFHVIPAPRTVFANVQRLPAGHCALFEHGRVEVRPWWIPQFAPEGGRAPLEDLKQQFRALVRQSVSHERDGGKPGCFLSGGTDSSTVAGMLKAIAGDASSYSIGFQAEGYDEMAYARIAARHFGTEHHEYYVTPEDLVTSIPEVASHYDQPFGNSSAVPAFYCARMAKQDGITRILAGDGGDELFGGNSRYATQRVFGWYQQVPSPVRSALEPLFATDIVSRAPLLRKGSSYIRQAKVPLPDRLQTYNMLNMLGAPSLLDPAFLEGIQLSGPIVLQREVWRQCVADDPLDRQLAFDWRFTLAENDLPKVVGTTNLAGIGVGFPLLDHALVDFSMRLPTQYKLRGLRLRWFFKEALRGFLPDEIITKKKHGFGLPFGIWAVRHRALGELARESLRSFATRGVVKPAFVDRLLTEHLPAHPGYYGEMVWILMMLEQWLARHRPNFRVQ